MIFIPAANYLTLRFVNSPIIIPSVCSLAEHFTLPISYSNQDNRSFQYHQVWIAVNRWGLCLPLKMGQLGMMKYMQSTNLCLRSLCLLRKPDTMNLWNLSKSCMLRKLGMMKDSLAKYNSLKEKWLGYSTDCFSYLTTRTLKGYFHNNRLRRLHH